MKAFTEWTKEELIEAAKAELPRIWDRFQSEFETVFLKHLEMRGVERFLWRMEDGAKAYAEGWEYAPPHIDQDMSLAFYNECVDLIYIATWELIFKRYKELRKEHTPTEHVVDSKEVIWALDCSNSFKSDLEKLLEKSNARKIESVGILQPSENCEALYINHKKVVETEAGGINEDVVYSFLKVLGYVDTEAVFERRNWKVAEEHGALEHSEDGQSITMYDRVVWESGDGCPFEWPFKNINASEEVD